MAYQPPPDPSQPVNPAPDPSGAPPAPQGPPAAYPQQPYPQQPYPQQGYPQQPYPPQGYPQQGAPGYPPAGGPPAYGAPPAGYAPYPQQPYNAAGAYPYKGFWIRFVAAVIDGLIFFVPAFILATAFFSSGAGCTAATYDAAGNYVAPSCTSGGAGVLYTLVYIAEAAYLVILWGMGGTVGQRLLGMKVVDATTGQTIGIGKGFLRLVGYIVASIPFSLGLMWAGWDPRKQGWHDKIANTVVVAR